MTPRKAMATAGGARLLAPVALTILIGGCGAGKGSTRQPGASRAATPVTYRDYRVLARRGPSGITVLSQAQARAAATTRTHPIWIAVSPEHPAPIAPIVDSAREVRHEGTARVWLSKATDGGICMLTFNPELSPEPNHAHALAALCVIKNALCRGVSARERLADGAWTAVGVVPNSVPYVTLHLANGQTQTTSVANNAYRTTVPTREVSVSFERQGVEYY
jgi:hypothetical protein